MAAEERRSGDPTTQTLEGRREQGVRPARERPGSGVPGGPQVLALSASSA